MKASICLATHNKPILLKRSLDSIFAQLPGFDFEVIVVMDGSDEPTKEVLRTSDHMPNLKTHWIPNGTYRNPCFARNIASKMACGDIIIHQSDDVVHGDTLTIRKLVDRITPSNMVVATVWNTEFPSMQRLEQYTGSERQFGAFFLGGVTRKNFYEVAGNCEEFNEPGFDDNWLCESFTKGLGLELVFASDIIGLHQHHPRPPLDVWYGNMKALFERKCALARSTGNPRDWMGAAAPWPYEEGKSLL